jgi:hypothetical protein
MGKISKKNQFNKRIEKQNKKNEYQIKKNSIPQIRIEGWK